MKKANKLEEIIVDLENQIENLISNSHYLDRKLSELNGLINRKIGIEGFSDLKSKVESLESKINILYERNNRYRDFDSVTGKPVIK